MADIRERLGWNIARLRKKKGWTQGKLADMIEISSTFMMHIEHGTRGASLETVELLARALDVDIPVLFTEPRNQNESDMACRENSNKLETDLLKKVSQTISSCFDDYYDK